MAIIKVKTGGITADAITSTEIADNAVVTAAINADAVTDAKIADDVVGTEHLTANEVDTAALKADAVTGAQLADDAVNSEHYTDGSIDTAHIADNQVTLAKMAGGTDGNIISFDASGDPVAIATGNDGQVLTSTGAGSPPAFEAIPGGGKIGQVLSETKVSTFSSTSDSMADISGLAVAITPSATSSKVLVMVNFNVSTDLDNRFTVFQLVRGSTAISIGAASGNRTVGSVAHVRVEGSGSGNEVSEYTINFLDSPSTTSATTYKMQGLAQSDDNPGFRINMTGSDSNAVHGFRLASTITVMEVLA